MKRSRLRLGKAEYKKLCDRNFRRDNFKCRVCRRRAPCSQHHIIYRSRGGDDADWNMITLCETCHIEGIHQRHLVLLPNSPDDLIDANKPVEFMCIDGWKPPARRERRE